jgi:hypothetical protein
MKVLIFSILLWLMVTDIVKSLVGEAEKESGKDIFIATKIPSMKREWPAGKIPL